MLRTSIFLVFTFASLLSFSRQLEFDIDQPGRKTLYDSLFSANDWRSRYDDRLIPHFGENWRNRILKVGDKISDLVLGEKILNSSGIARLSDYPGKLIILDFWATWCGPCIRGLPYMEGIQEKFKGEVQMLFVNFFESKEDIEKVLKKRPINAQIPVIVASEELMAAFPTQTVPYHIWIDSSKTVRLIGTGRNTNTKKIQDLLVGKNVHFLTDENWVAKFEAGIPYYKVLGEEKPKSKYFSFFTKFNPNYSPQFSGSAVYVRDSIDKTTRSTFVNMSVLDLFRVAYFGEIIKNGNKIVLNPHYTDFVLRVNDTLSVTEYFYPFSEQDEEIYTKSKFCYEQIVPDTWSKEEIRNKMKVDLNEYLGRNNGIKADFLSSFVNAKTLIRANTRKSKKYRNETAKTSKDTFFLHGKKVVRYKNVTIGYALKASGADKVFFKQYPDYFLLDLNDKNQEEVSEVIIPLHSTFSDIENILSLQGYKFEDKKVSLGLLYIKNSFTNK